MGQEVFLSLKIPSYGPCFVGPDTVMEKDYIVGVRTALWLLISCRALGKYMSVIII